MKLAVFLIASSAFGATFSSTVQGVTNTQAVIKSSAASGTCTVEASESDTYSPLVPDVDPAVFTGAGTFTAAELAGGAVIGHRKAEWALTGKQVSRALQTRTAHYYRITCGSDTSTGHFVTANIALGNTFNDPIPASTTAGQHGYYTAGEHAWPTIDWSDIAATKAKGVVDPQTGILIKPMTVPGEQAITYSPGGDHAFESTFTHSGGWTNPDDILVDDGNSATYTGTTRDPLVVVRYMPDGSPNIYFVDGPIEWITVTLKGSCTGACAGNNSKISICLTLDNVACWQGSKTIDVTLTTSPATYTAGTTVPILDSWTLPGYQPFNKGDISGQSSNVNVDVSGVVSWVSGTNYISANMAVGSTVFVGGQTCTVSAVGGSQSLTITPASCPGLSLPATFVAYAAHTFGILIRKTTTSTDQINLQYAFFTQGDSQVLDYSALSSGSVQNSSAQLTTSGGQQGYYSTVSTGASQLYWVNKTTGVATYAGIFNLTPVGGTDGFGTNFFNNCGGTSLYAPNSTDINFYCISFDNQISPQEVLVSCTISSVGGTPACTNLTPASTGTGIVALVTAFSAGDTPAYDGSWGGCGVNGIQNGKIVMGCGRGSQDSLGWQVIFDPFLVGSAAGCVGGGAPGCVVAVASSWGTTPARWCGVHTRFVSGLTSDTYWIAGKFLQDNGVADDGPYTSEITSALLTSTPTIAAGVGSCPGGSQGCDNITTDGEPCDHSPHGENVGPRVCPTNPAWAFLQNIAVGDVLVINSEFMRVSAKTDATHWQVQRGYGYPGNPSSQFSGPASHGGTTMFAFCGAMDFSGTGAAGISNWSWTWDTVADPHGTNPGGATVLVAYDYDHPTPRPNYTTGGTPSYAAGCLAPVCYGARTTGAMGNAPNLNVSAAPAFGNANGVTRYLLRAEDHPSRLQDAASSIEQQWLLDGRPLEARTDVTGDASLVTGNLYKMTSTTSDGDNLTLIGGGGASISSADRKYLPTWAYCGTQAMTDASNATQGNSIGGTSTDAYKFCVARVGGECRSGSSQGDVYLNCPNASPRTSGGSVFGCAVSQVSASVPTDMCVGNSSQYLNSIAQVGFSNNDFTGALGRSITKGLTGYRVVDAYWHGRAFADASWAQIPSLWTGGTWTSLLLAKIPPYPQQDTVVRNTFIPIPVSISAIAGADHAAIQFGYGDYGASTSYYCTTRHESCVAGAGVAPFAFAATDSLTLTSCASGCTVTIPALSQRVLYYQVLGYNGSTLVSTGPQQTIDTP